MRDEDLFAEAWGGLLAGACCGRGLRGCDGFGGDAGEVAPEGVILWVEGEGDERGAGFDEVEVELARDVVAKGGCAHFGDGEAACGDDE